MKKIFLISSILMGLCIYAPATFAALASGETCVCTASDGSTTNFDATDAADCSNASNSSYTCSVTSTVTKTTTDTSKTSLSTGSDSSNSDATFVPLVPGGVPGLTSGITPTEASITKFLNNIYIFLIGIAVILAIGMIIYGAVQIVMNPGSPPMHSAGMRHVRQALFGLLLVLSPVVVFSVINPKILNLDINFPALKTPWGNSTVTNLNVSGNATDGYTETGVCGSDGCSGAISTCSSTNGFATCIKSDGSKYNPGTGTCKTGETVSCYTYTNPYASGI